jgi:hypothetical protein
MNRHYSRIVYRPEGCGQFWPEDEIVQGRFMETKSGGDQPVRTSFIDPHALNLWRTNCIIEIVDPFYSV